MDLKSQLTKPRGPHAIAACAPAQTATVMALFIGSVLAVMLFALPAFGQTAGQPMPDNASAKLYGDGRECNIGFRLNKSACVHVEPYEASANAYLNGSGYGQPWTCKRGFFEQAGLCEAVVIPANAYLNDTSYGSGWKCDRGYAASAETCEFINVPENAHLDRSGNRWECDKNFQKSKGLCVLNN